MFKKIAISIGTMLTVGVIALFAVGSVYAQSTTPPVPDAPFGNAWGRVYYGAGVVSDAITELLGMSEEEIYAERSAGKTLSDLAKEQGVTDEDMIKAMQDGRQEVIDQALEDGRITQEQAEWMQEAMNTMAPLMLTRPFGPGGMGGMHGGGYGRWGGAAPSATATEPDL